MSSLFLLGIWVNWYPEVSLQLTPTSLEKKCTGNLTAIRPTMKKK